MKKLLILGLLLIASCTKEPLSTCGLVTQVIHDNNATTGQVEVIYITIQNDNGSHEFILDNPTNDKLDYWNDQYQEYNCL